MTDGTAGQRLRPRTLGLGNLALGVHALDDAQLPVRFDELLVAGGGPVFEPGERVEGCSNLLR